MCKVLAIAGMRKGDQKIIEKLAKAAIKDFASTDGDGFGYSAITSDGTIYGEKWLNKEDAFEIHKNIGIGKSISMLNDRLGSAVKDLKTVEEETYESFGAKVTKELMNDTVGFMLHARKKTEGEKTTFNTHPFFYKGTKTNEDLALIHNGSIVNHEKLTKIYSTCDSETIMHEYVKQNVPYIPENIEEVAKTLIGFYTSIVMSSYVNKDGEVVPYMDIFRSGRDLYVGYIKELNNLVFCTSDYALKRICTEVGLTLSDVHEVNEENLIRLSAVTGERIGDLVKFNKSKTFQQTYYSGGHHRSHDNYVYPSQTDANAMKAIKKSFEEQHPEIFNSSYMTVSPMTKDEQDLFAELEDKGDEDNSHKRALYLVNLAINGK